MLEEIKRLADEYEISDDKVLKYYHQLLTELEKRPEIALEEDDERIISCLERIVSERASISQTKKATDKAYTVQQTILRAISTEFDLGLQTDEFAVPELEKLAHKVAYENDQTVGEYLSEETSKMDLQRRQGKLRLL